MSIQVNLNEVVSKSKDKMLLKKYEYYKDLGYNENQSFVLSLFTYSGYRYVGLTNSLNRIIGKYEEKYNVKKANIPFCDYVITLLSEILNKYIEKDREEDLEDYISRNVLEYFGDDIDEDLGYSVNKKSKGAFLGNLIGNTRSSSGVPMGARPVMMRRSNPRPRVVEKVMSIPSPQNSVSLDSSKNFLGSYNSIDCEDAMCFLNSESIISDVVDAVRTDSYEIIEEKGFLSPITNPTSTFRTTCNTASVGVIRNNLNDKYSYVKRDMVRIEELLNYFDYKLDRVNNSNKFSITTELCDKPGSNNKLFFVGIKGQEYIPEKQNICFLLDVSGSMMDNTLQCQSTFFTVLSKLNDGDVLSLITYSDTDETILDGYKYSKSEIDYIIWKFLKIRIEGCTYGSKGIETAYKVVKKNFIKDGVNHVILVTDGDLNFGITQKGKLEEFILEKKSTGAFLTVIGTGLYNYKDDKLEVLAKNGNGNYIVVNTFDDVVESVRDRYSSLVFSIAKDVKAQIEFNPNFVKSYRLIGYENRMLNHEDFNNDKVISEPFASGSYAIALYEIEPTKDGKIESDLKYQQVQFNDKSNFCSVSIRYKEIDKEDSSLYMQQIKYSELKETVNINLAYILYIIGEMLRNSDYVSDTDLVISDYLNNIKYVDEIRLLNGSKYDFLCRLIDVLKNNSV